MTRIQYRRNTAAGAAASNPVLAVGEPGMETDTGRTKLGDGTTAWNLLPYDAPGEAALNATYGPGGSAGNLTKSPSTKTDGQNVKNLRRPTLVVDSMFPNARMDHTILWTDEAAGRAYSLGMDGTLRLATWNPASAVQDIGVFPTGQRSYESSTQTWAFHGLFFRTSTGALLMEQLEAGITTLRRSTPASDGIAWTTVWTAAGDVIPLGPQSIAQDLTTGHLYFTEYSSGTVLTHIDILRSTDDGVTWTVFKSMPKHPGAAGSNGTIRHWHSARYDAVSQRVYFMAGDQSDIAGIYRVNAGGTDIEPVILNNQISAAPTYYARAVDVMFFPNYIVWGNDGSGSQNYIYRMHRDQIGQANPVTEQVAAIDNTLWYSQKVRTDGSMWVCSSSSEINGGPNYDDSIAHLYAVSNDGAIVDDIAAISMSGIWGSASLSGLSSAGSGGSTFWLRAHGHQQFPYKSNRASAFQFRARIAYGAVPFIKPINIRPAVYVPESRNFVGDLTASQTKTFAHTRPGAGTRRLTILNMGVKVLTGAANTVSLQVYDVTTATVIHTLTGTQNWRGSSVADTAEWAYQYALAPTVDQIEFRLIETGGNPVTVSAFIEFGFAI